MDRFSAKGACAIVTGWVCFFWLCTSLTAAPAARFGVENWTVDDGLHSDIVVAITQSHDGYLWLATLKGLTRFDGIRFVTFDESTTPGLNGSRIVDVFEDSNSNLWVATEANGLVRIKNGQAVHVDLGRDGSERKVRNIVEDAVGRVWFDTADGLLGMFENGTVNVIDFPNYRLSYCRSLAAEKSGPLWMGTDRGQFAIGPDMKSAGVSLSAATRLDFLLASRDGGYWRLADGQIDKWSGTHLVKTLGPYPWSETAPGFISSVCEDPDGDLVVGTLGQGIYWFDSSGKSTHLTSEQGLSHNYILCLCFDQERNLWVGTDSGGLNRLKPQAFKMEDETRGLTVQSVCTNAGGGIWFSTYSTNGVFYAHNGTNQAFNARQGLNNVNVQTVFSDHLQRLWVGTREGKLFRSDNGIFKVVADFSRIKPGVPVSAIYEDPRGLIWVGVSEGLARFDGANWTAFTRNDGLSANAISALGDDGGGGLWIGTDGGGLNHLSNGHFTAFNKADGLPSGHVSSLYRDAEGVLWVGTDGGGLGRYDNGKWKVYTARDGLVSNGIGYLLEDGEGYLWLGSNAGLMRVKKKALNDFSPGEILPCRVYAEPDGLLTRECSEGSQPAACQTSDGTLWFPTIRGLVSVNPRDLHPNTNPPPVVIESVLLEGKPQNTDAPGAAAPDAVTVPAGHESLEIQYTSLDLGASGRAHDQSHFKCCLEVAGRPSVWTDVGGVTTAHYPKLPPGHYRFKVTACNEDGMWNDTGASLAIIVLPPFWQTWWFIITMVLLLGGLIAAIVHYLSTQKLQRQLAGLRQQQALEKDRQRIARDIHDQLGASLTHVALLGELVESDKESPAEVEAHARQISQTARDTSRSLDEIVWAVNPSNDTLDSLVTYFCKQAQEYLEAAGMRYRLEVPPTLPATSLGPELRHNVFMAAKEAVTNVARHSGANTAWIRLRLEPGRFTLEIEDNGKGMEGMDEKRARTRNGLTNMRKRMEESGGSFSIGKGAGGGTLVRLNAPLRN